MPCEFEGRDWGGASERQGKPNVSRTPAEARGETTTASFPSPQRAAKLPTL